jgi:hypothetical protein
MALILVGHAGHFDHKGEDEGENAESLRHDEGTSPRWK